VSPSQAPESMPQLGIDRKARYVIWVGDLEASPRPGRVGAASAQRGPRVRFSGLQATPAHSRRPRPHTTGPGHQAPGSARPTGPGPPPGIAPGAHTARSTPPGLRRPHPDRPSHQRGPMAAPAPGDPPGRLGLSLGSTPARAPPGTLCKFAQGRPTALSPPVHVFRSPASRPHRACARRGVLYVTHLFRMLVEPPLDGLENVSLPPAGNRRRPPGGRQNGAMPHGPSHRPPPRLYSARGTGLQ